MRDLTDFDPTTELSNLYQADTQRLKKLYSYITLVQQDVIRIINIYKNRTLKYVSEIHGVRLLKIS